ncbi:IPT/TIG domain-containing protein [Candidatus Nomurabacteria bacterium]|nr:IPT/TIG domain-containing protein [Candidatus Nomurabacteria bacterium]
MKKIFGFIFVLVVIVFSFGNISDAALGDFVAVVTVENVKSTVATLNISGLDPNIANYDLILSTTSKPDVLQSIYSDSKGLATVSFSDLTPETKYTVSLAYLNDGVKSSRPNLTSFKTTIAKAKITSFLPTEGNVGELITIKGEDLFGISKISFGNTESKVESIISREEITARVPASAVDGEIVIKTLDYGEATSTNKFRVIYNSTLIIENGGITETGVNLKALNLIPDEHYTVYIADADSNFKVSNDHIAIYSDSAAKGTGRAVFSGLLPGHRYIAAITLDSNATTINWNSKNIPSSISFTTLGGTSGGEESIKVENITLTSVDITISGLGQGKDEICIYKNGAETTNVICDKRSGGITYDTDTNNTVTGMTKYVGKIHIDGLVAGTSYIAALVKNGDMNTISVREPFATNSAATNTPSSTVKTGDSALYKGGIVPECNTGEIDTATGQYKNPCNFSYFMDLINRLIKFLLFVIATPLVALILMYTGYLYITSGGNASQVEKVKHILLNAVVGYVIALAAWLVINTIVTTLLDKEAKIDTFLDRSSMKK